jgi:hypothetical protein
MKNKINIRPDTGVYSTYKRLSYKAWTALAEFVDNSTQSYYDNIESLKSTKYYRNLTIEIEYDEDNKNGDTLIIKDDANGMEIDDFKRALILNKPPLTTSGRNEFGMGLKTAASWFGNVWSVETTQLGSTKKYFAEIDVENLAKYKDEFIEFVEEDVNRNEHYTIIKISNLNQRLKNKKTNDKVKRFLSSIYRQDIRTNEIEIFFNGELLAFEDVEPYTDPNGKVWKRDVDFEIEHQNELLRVKGFIGIRLIGSTSDAGYTLLRRGRVIIGGPGSNYRPTEVFGATTTFSYQRLYGELNLDNWSVTQAKDGFDWYSDDLEEKFITKLVEISEDFKVKASEIRTNQKIEIEDVIKESIKKSKSSNSNEESDFVIKKANKDFIIDEIATDQEDSNNNQQQKLEINNNTPLEVNYKSYKFIINIENGSVRNNWMQLEGINKDGFHLMSLNGSHPFFFPFVRANPSFLHTLIRFSVALAIAEISSADTSVNGKISPSQIRIKMNEILQELSKDVEDN